MKGISPLIAAVLLIVFTMAIAGILATWATQFATGQLEQSTCGLALTIENLRFESGTVIVAFRNNDPKVNLTGLSATLTYPDLTTSNYFLNTYGANDPLPPLFSTTARINTTITTKPQKIMVVAQNCPKGSVTRTFD